MSYSHVFTLEGAAEQFSGEGLPVDLILFRHGKPQRDQKPELRPDLPEKMSEIVSIDESQPLVGEGHTQARALGRRLFSTLPNVEVCLTSDVRRCLETAEDVVSQYPDDARPQVIPFPLLRERFRGEDHPIVISKKQFYDKYPELGSLRDTRPSFWKPRRGEELHMAGLRLLTTLVITSSFRPEEPLLVSTSGEMCIASFVNPLLGNMSDEQLVRGFGEGMPAKAYGLTASTHYTRRNPHDPEDTRLSRLYSHMRVQTPDTGNPDELKWDTGWIEIER